MKLSFVVKIGLLLLMENARKKFLPMLRNHVELDLLCEHSLIQTTLEIVLQDGLKLVSISS